METVQINDLIEYKTLAHRGRDLDLQAEWYEPGERHLPGEGYHATEREIPGERSCS